MSYYNSWRINDKVQWSEHGFIQRGIIVKTAVHQIVVKTNNGLFKVNRKKLLPDIDLPLILSRYKIKKRGGCFSVYSRRKNWVKVSEDLTDRRDAEVLVADLLSGRLNDTEARKQSIKEINEQLIEEINELS